MALTKIMLILAYDDGREVPLELDLKAAEALGGLAEYGSQLQPYLEDDDLRALEIAKLLQG